MAVTDDAIVAIKAMIVSGELHPGDRLPNEVDLATRIGVSRNSLREAVRALTLLRILDPRQGVGTYVTSLEPGVLLETLSFVVDLHRGDRAPQLLEIRRILEPAATAMAARAIDRDRLAGLHQTMLRVEAAAQIEELVAADSAFHHEIAEAAGNPAMVAILDNLVSAIARARIWRGITESGATARTLTEHRAIYDALAAGHYAIAHAAAAAHVGGVELWLRQAAATQ
ncbi:MAG: FadR/GntR family transcriptional regulator [Mycobacteriales bacterium]